MEGPGLKVALIGATGAIGKEIVRAALENNKVSEISLLIRKKIPEWETPEFTEKAAKVKFLICDNFDNLDNLRESLLGYDIFLCTLGSRVGTGTENFVKVDY